MESLLCLTMDWRVSLIGSVMLLGSRSACATCRKLLFFFDKSWASQNYIKLLHGLAKIIEADVGGLAWDTVMVIFCTCTTTGLIGLRSLDHLELAHYLQHLHFYHCAGNLIDSVITCLDSNSFPDIFNELSVDFGHMLVELAEEFLSRDHIRVESGVVGDISHCC